ncbi:MAG: Crp/Fnr family transcriptional regulator [Pyrinomonadaceae bacterium]|nr:Crp/Fnr family transcriptional regulator [Pyrinomonadaceae bacterium]
MLRANQLEEDETFGEGVVDERLTCDSLPKEIHESKDIRVSNLHRRGAVLFSEGQHPRGVYVLRVGRAKVSMSSSEGKVWLLRIAQPGDLLGLNSALKDSPYDATVEALEPCCTDFISRPDFMDLLGRSEKSRLQVSEALSKELTEVLEHARSLLLPKTTGERLAKLLVKWCNERGEAGPDGIRVNSGLTQEEIAQMICATRETVTRLFAELKRKQIVSLTDNAILVRNRKSLDALAGC